MVSNCLLILPSIFQTKYRQFAIIRQAVHPCTVAKMLQFLAVHCNLGPREKSWRAFHYFGKSNQCVELQMKWMV